jgi:cyclohexadienyl dehydratase
VLLSAGLCAIWVAIPSTAAQEPDATELVVGTSGDYAPFSLENEETPGVFSGFDIELARRYAADRGVALRFVRFRWPFLLENLRDGNFDVVMSGVTVRAERSVVGSFGLPTLETGALVLVRKDSWAKLEELDRPHIRIGVNAGGHLERVTALRFPRATRIAIADNAAVLAALREWVVDAVVTDSAEAPRWREQLPGLIALGPFTRDRKAPLVRADHGELAADLDAWLLEAERDGRLEALRQKHVGAGPWRATAEPLAALLAAVDERLSLMPLVGYVKRSTGLPLEVPEREEVVLEAASKAVALAASQSDRVPPPPESIRRFFRAQMEAAKQVQRDTVADTRYEPAAPLPDLDAELRPALLRIGARIARLLLWLPPGIDADRMRAEATALLREPRLSPDSRGLLVAALFELSNPDIRPPAEGIQPADQPRENARASSPAATGSTMQTP